MSINLLLVDDHAIVTDGLSALLAEESGIVIKGAASDGQMALEMLRVLKVDIVLMDIEMPIMNGIEAAKAMVREFPDLKIIMLTMFDERQIIKELLDLGVKGYMLKNSSKSDLLKCIQLVQNNEVFVSEEIGSISLQSQLEQDKKIQSFDLTDREVEIIKLIAEGLSNKEIGERLFISHRTVDTHRTNLMNKIGVHNVAGIVKFAIVNGLSE